MWAKAEKRSAEGGGPCHKDWLRSQNTWPSGCVGKSPVATMHGARRNLVGARRTPRQLTGPTWCDDSSPIEPAALSCGIPPSQEAHIAGRVPLGDQFV
jgi:hypothetical protein